MSEERDIAAMEIDIEIADIAEILLAHQAVIPPPVSTVVEAIWRWKEARMAAAWDEGFSEGQEYATDAYWGSTPPLPDNPHRAPEETR